MVKNQESWKEKILALKEEKGALILSHNYQLPEIQDVADFVGDSLELSLEAQKTDRDLIVFCGVYFMAEVARILSGKRVLMPVLTAGCPLANMATREAVLRMKEEHPKAAVVTYINSSAEVKAVSDVICTSANALKIVEKVPQEEIIFVPDQGLGGWVKEHTNKIVHLWPGFCPTHYRIMAEDIMKARSAHPEAKVLVHPECRPEVRRLADQVLGTGGMLRFVRSDSASSYIIGTEEGLLYRLRKENPQKQFFLASPLLLCPNMKKTDAAALYECLRNETGEIKVPEEIASQARRSLLLMLELT
ncbi:MAG: quinolinate synthase NadA [bacterium]